MKYNGDVSIPREAAPADLCRFKERRSVDENTPSNDHFDIGWERVGYLMMEDTS